MRDEPTGEQLLDSARNVLREQLMPALPAASRHAALMIANAMSIAMRQLQNGDEPERAELRALEKILLAGDGDGDGDGDGAGEAGTSMRARLKELNRRLSHWIRDGQADAGEIRDAVRAHLVQVARTKVGESNPKYLGNGARTAA
ncbi:hypothetical protein SAMN05421829_1223 [Aromatoleum tolulyticum]|uniref:DUF6285 domain-containing protein n=1 Tax=Aromatoleum tolulyticum TaxID=34027 RepID=A0A1N7C5E8_9RHOO|nr:DUF6285 domain-containing protein [Aromatoleum tolulyticum]SIR58747.1 hypothetical protein SAMN05421829_1223 [Aromatoleum tolulyticum]